MDELKKYLKNILGIELEIKPLASNSIRGLPYYIIQNYDFSLANLFYRNVILVQVKENFTADQLSRHLILIQKVMSFPVIAIIKPIEAYNRSRLIDKKVPFIIPGKQMYLPDLLIHLGEIGTKPEEPQETMQPAAQFLLLYHLQVASLEGINFKEIADKLFYKSITVTRAAYYLHNVGLSTIQGTKEKYIHFELSKKELWEKAEPLMNNPIKKTLYYSGFIHDNNFRETNINALSNYTDLNPSHQQYMAIKSNYLQHVEGVNLKSIGELEGNICIEEWKYDPARLSDTKFVDPLSLYLCFRESKDERVQDALEQIIKKQPW